MAEADLVFYEMINNAVADVATEALRKIAAGSGYYGEQAREYKTIAGAALQVINVLRSGLTSTQDDPDASRQA